jgi:uncharacterized protein DUF1629
MYFRLQVEPTLRSGYVQKEANQNVTLMRGSLEDEDSLTLPWPFTVIVDEEEGLEMSDFYPDNNLMSKRLVATLQSVGVDNLQTFPAEIRNSATGENIHDFVAVNIVGLVSCADVGASTSSPLADVRYFHRLVIDPKRADGLHVFRLAESRMDVIVDDAIAEAIRTGTFTDVVLESLQETDAG